MNVKDKNEQSFIDTGAKETVPSAQCVVEYSDPNCNIQIICAFFYVMVVQFSFAIYSVTKG